MSAADHETALRRADLVERLRFRATGATVNEQHITAALHTEAAAEIVALVGLLRQTEQERDEWKAKWRVEATVNRDFEACEAALTRISKYPYLDSKVTARAMRKFARDALKAAEQEVERLKRGNQERENEERETANAVEVEAGELSRSVQTRCSQWGVHEPPLSRPQPCEECYSLIVTSERVPWRSPERWHPLTSTTGISDALPAPDSALVCVRCVRLEEALREIEHEADDQAKLFAAPNGSYAWIADRASAALAAVGVPPESDT